MKPTQRLLVFLIQATKLSPSYNSMGLCLAQSLAGWVNVLVVTNAALSADSCSMAPAKSLICGELTLFLGLYCLH